MKILKVVLQNINSLKSDEPIVIDYESALFQDVGLYAITGSTGAGKTTILDAITIGLYHQVPRFNKSNIKAGLEEVVSYGAHGALCQVTFENNGIRYESTWTLRLASKQGKALSSPIETVRLKNLSDKKILAEKKRDAQKRIIEITQLDYNQFLRSAMLAQGEFASFLSATAKEKGTLLEQITGEEVYKKIGEAINQRIGEERSKLNDISSRINHEDLLSQEEEEALKTEQANLKTQNGDIDRELTETSRILSWHTTHEKLKGNQLKLSQEEEALEQEKARQQGILIALNSHEAAMPFESGMTEVKRLSEELNDKKDRHEKVKTQLEELTEKIANTDNHHQQAHVALEEEEKALNNWLPKLDEVARLDTQIIGHQKAHTKTQEKVQEQQSALEQFNASLEKAYEEKETSDAQLDALTSYFDSHQHLPAQEKQFASWSTLLSNRNHNHNRLEKGKTHVSEKGEKIVEQRAGLDTKQEALAEAKKDFKALADQSDALKTRQAKGNLNDLIKEHQHLNQQQGRLQQLSLLSEQYRGLEKKSNELADTQTYLENELQSLQTSIESLTQQLAQAEQSLADAERILSLEQSVKSYEADRLKLKEGEPCPLCGAIHHPFASEHDHTPLSETEAMVSQRKKAVADIQNQNKQTELQQAKVKQRLDGQLEEGTALEQDLKGVNERFSAISSDFNITKPNDIEEALKSFNDQLSASSTSITAAQELQKDIEDSESAIRQKTVLISGLEQDEVQLKERIQNEEEQLERYNEELIKISNEIEATEQTLKDSFAQFSLSLPSTQQSSIFLEELEAAFAQYRKNEKQRSQLNERQSSVKTSIASKIESLAEKKAQFAVDTEDQKKLEQALKELRDQREQLLPIELTHEQKRASLQAQITSARQKLNVTTKALEQLNTQSAERKQEQRGLATDMLQLEQQLSQAKASLHKALPESPFDTIEEVASALLSAEKKMAYLQVRKNLEERTTALTTKTAELKRAIEEQKEQRNFKLSQEESTAQHERLNLEKTRLQERSGEIKKQFEIDAEIKSRNEQVFGELKEQEKSLKKYQDLMKLLGGSQHAFNTYVQRLTLQNLIQKANIHLARLKPRYSLRMNDTYKPGQELDFSLIDHYQTNQARLVDTSSGGEKFIISLALALGLSDLASQNVNIESLFIDEGFGTLDNNSLETVISTLETLQAQGKMIGIISHVESLKERITTQIQVLKKSNGVSEVKMV